MEPKPMSPKPLTPEEIAIIRSYATEIGCYEVNTLGLLSHIDALQAENERLRAALSEIERGRGPRSPDPLTHADNIIANLQRIATGALAGTWEPEA